MAMSTLLSTTSLLLDSLTPGNRVDLRATAVLLGIIVLEPLLYHRCTPGTDCSRWGNGWRASPRLGHHDALDTLAAAAPNEPSEPFRKWVLYAAVWRD